MSQLTSNFAFIFFPSNNLIVYWGCTALQSFVGFSNGPTTWIPVDGGEVVEEEADDVAEADVDEEEVNANGVDRLRVLKVLNIRNEGPKQLTMPEI